MNGNDVGAAQISSRDILAVVFRRKIPIIMCAVIVIVATLTAVSRTTSVYQATAKVLLRRTGASALSTTWTPFYGLEEEMNTEVELVTLRVVLERAAEILNEEGVVIHIQSGDSTIVRKPMARDLGAGISAGFVEMSNIILIKYTGADQSFVGEAANAVAQAYVEHRIQIRKAAGFEEFFAEQLQKAEDRLIQLKEEEMRLRKEGEIYDLEWQYQVAIGRRGELQKMLAEIRSERIAEELKLKLARSRLEEDPDLLVPFPYFERSRIGGEMLNHYWNLRRQRDDVASKYTETHPEVRMMDDKIGRMEERFRQEVARVLKEKEFLLEDLRAEERGFESEIQSISDNLRQTPEVVAQIEHLQKEIYYTYLHYDKVLEKMLDTIASEANDIRISNAKLVGPAVVQMTKAGKMQTVYVAFSILLGITLGIGFGFLLDNMDHSVKSAIDVEDIIGLPLLGSVPDNRRLPELTRHIDRIIGQD